MPNLIYLKPVPFENLTNSNSNQNAAFTENSLSNADVQPGALAIKQDIVLSSEEIKTSPSTSFLKVCIIVYVL